jgi:predicted PurR-regulated permease PerM
VICNSAAVACPNILGNPVSNPCALRARAAEPPQAPPKLRDSFDTLNSPARPLVSLRLQRISLVVVVVLTALAAAWVASALWAGLLLGVLTAFTIEPWNRYLLQRWPGRRSLAAAITVTFTGLLCAGVLAGLMAIITRELLDAAYAARDVARSVSPSEWLGPSVQRSLEAVGITPGMLSDRLAHLADRATEIISGVVSVALGSTFSVLGGVLLAFVTAYYALKDQHPIERRLQRILPLNPQITSELVEDFRKVGRGTLLGSVVAGLIQGAFAAVGFAIAGVPRALVLGVLTAVASFVPVFGTILVWIPVSVGLFVTGHPVAGAFELAWGMLITTTLVDYVIRPVVVGRGSRSHPLLFLIGVIGGVEVLGGVGVIAGPIVMAFFSSVLRIYRRDVVDQGSDVAG